MGFPCPEPLVEKGPFPLLQGWPSGHVTLLLLPLQNKTPTTLARNLGFGVH